MLDIDLEKAAKLIEIETNSRPILANVMAKQLTAVHEDLYPIVEAWLNGERPDFQFQDISISYIQNREKGPYVSSIFTMSTLLKNPEMIKGYKESTFESR